MISQPRHPEIDLYWQATGTIMASPHEHRPLTWRERLGLPPAPRGRPVWWRPPWGQLLRHAGWWWVLLVGPLAVGSALLTVAILGGRPYAVCSWLGIRVVTAWLIIPPIAWGSLRLKVMRLRTDPYCIHCGYTLIGLPEEGKCPECGRPYRMKVVEMFRRDPQWVMAWWRLSGRPPTVERFEQGHRRKD
ncbi:MAG TPA: hypothetical protein VGI81_21855 [Tepidisphaeraceae bacterium]|jgi:hypothetical protein